MAGPIEPIGPLTPEERIARVWAVKRLGRDERPADDRRRRREKPAEDRRRPPPEDEGGTHIDLRA